MARRLSQRLHPHLDDVGRQLLREATQAMCEGRLADNMLAPTAEWMTRD